MSRRQWETLAELLTEVVNNSEEATWQDKKNEFVRQMKDNGADTALGEILNWFDKGEE